MGKVRIFSYSEEPFRDRVEAGRLLAGELEKLHLKDAVVLGIPRGGIVIARELAFILNADLDIVLSRKLGAAGNPELAIGAVGEDGKLFLNETAASVLSEEKTYIEQEKTRSFAVIKRRSEKYRQILPKVSLKDRSVIVTDDGIATGATMRAALWIARGEHPQRLLAALPVGPPDTLQRLAEDVDDLVCLRAPALFSAIGQFYLDFSQVEDEEVLEILRKEVKRKGKKNLPFG
ncbi:MAG: hypothetical protein A3J51_00905 [Omnitrophica WOR_2 bacterium RIFCSPHIGHO2_02_FULL_45_21]|nr:MAG: hypothetical protein A3J51_00905 [Omnitrophica WOR_2 bacterium RIFCSPHIGHO2_02_FULL_45_21]